jgi:hypothetical protein
MNQAYDGSCLNNEKIAGQIIRKTFRLEIARQIARSSVGLRKNRNWTSRKCRAPPKRNKKLHMEKELEMWGYWPHWIVWPRPLWGKKE